MDASEPRAHGGAIRGLFSAAAVERLGHALMLRGPRGVGKFRAACWLAMGLLCERLNDAEHDTEWSPCGVCPSCKKVLSGGWRGNHPDLLILDPIEEGWNEIPVQAVADRGSDGCIGDFLRLASAEGRGRVVVVREAERLNVHAQNALLKTLEEPSDGTFLVLEASRPEALLDTIVSRVLQVRLGALEADDALSVLRELATRDEDLAGCELEALAALAHGAPGEARRLAVSGGLESLRLFERWLSGGDALRAAGEVWELEARFEASTALGRDRERARQTLDLLRELLSEAHRRAAVDVGGAGAGELVRVAEKLVPRGAAALATAIDSVLRARADIDRNLDPGATLERAFLGVDRSLAVAGTVPKPAGRL
ncbi:MAG: DNA polymerase III subunit [Planctomycetota bacterium]|jgi:DNA polymerase-3 subunit delta'